MGEAAVVRVYTIGHSNVAAERLLELLRQHAIETLVDVRSSPYSRYCPQFNREPLKATLEGAGLSYVYAGDYLGGRPQDPALYRPSGEADQAPQVDYAAVAATERYQRGIRRLLGIAASSRTAVMCSEEDPAHCHRQHLLSQTLLAAGVDVQHIRGSGELQAAWADGAPRPDEPRQLGLGI